METETILGNHVTQFGCVQDVQQWAQHGTLWNAEYQLLNRGCQTVVKDLFSYEPEENCKSTREQLLSSRIRVVVSVSEGRGPHNQMQQTYPVIPAWILLCVARNQSVSLSVRL